MRDEFIWVEKYRPKTIDDCILPESTYEDWEDAVAQMKSKTKTEDLLELIKPFMMLRIPTDEG